jgi:hypothetical protein
MRQTRIPEPFLSARIAAPQVAGTCTCFRSLDWTSFAEVRACGGSTHTVSTSWLSATESQQSRLRPPADQVCVGSARPAYLQQTACPRSGACFPSTSLATRLWSYPVAQPTPFRLRCRSCDSRWQAGGWRLGLDSFWSCRSVSFRGCDRVGFTWVLLARCCSDGSSAWR